MPLLLNLVWDGEGQTTLMQTSRNVSRKHRNRKDVTVFHGHTLAELVYSELIGLVQRTRVTILRASIK